jgi:transcriptional regulator with XRE-family HTH domain
MNNSIRIKVILKRLLTEHDITTAQLARATKLAPQTLNNWLSGQQPRNLSQLKMVADYFGVSVDFLVYGKEEKAKTVLEKYEDEINAGTFEVVLRRVKK